MLVQVENGKYYSSDIEIAYIFTTQPWKTRQLQALAFIERDREVSERAGLSAVMGGIFGTVATGGGVIPSWAMTGYIPATIMCSIVAAGCFSATIPGLLRLYRTPRHHRALEIASNRNHAIVVRKHHRNGWESDAYSMMALLNTSAGETLRGMFSTDIARNKKEIIAQLSLDGSKDRLFLRLKPVLDEYFRSTAEMDKELAVARNKEGASRPAAEISKNEKEIDAFAAEVATELAALAKIHKEEVDTRAKTNMEMASDNLRMARDAFRLQRGNYMPEN